MNSHNKSFFIKSTGMLIRSNATEPFMNLTFIKKKQDGGWEKPSNKEGLVVKMGLEEIAAIIEVLSKRIKEFKTVHKYKEKTTAINVSWSADKDGKKAEIVWFNVGGYKVYITQYQIIVCHDLFKHCYDEKIAQATASEVQSPRVSEEKEAELAQEEVVEEPTPDMEEPVPTAEELGLEEPVGDELLSDAKSEPTLDDTTVLKTAILGSTEKAIKVNYNGADKWIPKSKIHSQYDINKKEPQSFIVESWLLKK